jgi:hypothetical protein
MLTKVKHTSCEILLHGIFRNPYVPALLKITIVERELIFPDGK